MTPATLCVEGASWRPRRGAAALLHQISFDLAPGGVLAVVGPNGAGKTTLLRLLYRYHRATEGAVRLDGVDIWSMPARAAAMQVAAVLQEQPSDFALTVREIVALGRIPHRRGLSSTDGEHDQAVVQRTLARLDLEPLSGRPFGALSGGERQRVMVARALAQEPRLLILDEPTNHLDIRHQLEVLSLIRSLPLTIVTSLHDLNLAAGVCDAVLLLQDGRARAFGPPAEVLTNDTVSRAFHVTARWEQLAPSNTDHLTFQL